ncbi:MAG: hypothetical protein HY580_01405 [Nitrospinae bacterium]|nr:hypothetical protein [Nitrospinota bacterium]
MIQLMRKIFTMRFPWNTWVLLLAAANMAGGLYFFDTREGKFALFAMAGSMLVMQIVFNRHGFVRLLGLGHILFWTPFIGMILWRLQSGTDLRGDYRFWLISVGLLNSISLIIDVVDVWRYSRGERDEM